MSAPVCATCKDTHRMDVQLRSGDWARWLCTSCPVPCARCVERGRNGGPGAYCASTPCVCSCHEKKEESKDLQGSGESV